jgi:hypothetical protein
MNTKKLENSPSFPSVTYISSSDQRFICYGILRIDKTAETVWDRLAAESKSHSEDYAKLKLQDFQTPFQ